jgi:WD40 repeat protein
MNPPQHTLLTRLTEIRSLADNERNLVALTEQIRTGVGIVPFVGAGMSVPFGFPAWRPFLESQAPNAVVRKRLATLLDRGFFEEAAELLLQERGEKEFQTSLEDAFGESRLPQPLPAAAILQLPRLCSGPVLTTNFDPVLEHIFENARRPFEERIFGMDVKALRRAYHENRRVLVKLHGDATVPSTRVLTLSDYKRAYRDKEPLKPVLRFAMQARPLLFLGCSLYDDRTVQVLNVLSKELRQQKAADLLAHFAIVEKPENAAEAKARHRRLTQMGILPIWYPKGQYRMVDELMLYLASKIGRSPVCGSVPEEPPHYLPRIGNQAQLRTKLLASKTGNVAITSPGQTVGLEGMGGVGKTVLAATLTRDPTVQEFFSDGIFWLTVTSNPNLLQLLNQFSKWIPGCEELWVDEKQAREKLREILHEKHVLLILDDVWSVDHAVALNVVSAPGRLLITTRNSEILAGLDAYEFRVGLLTPEEALKLLAKWANVSTVNRLPAVAADVARECGYLPLALAMLGALVRQRAGAWADALELLRGRDLGDFKRTFPDYPYPDLFRAIEVSVVDLSSEERERYLDLAVFSEGLAMPEASLRVLWHLSPSRTRLCMDRFVARSLATREGKEEHSRLRLHDLLGCYMRKVREKELPAIHRRFIDNYQEKCPDGWHAGPDDGYFFQSLIYHLAEIGAWREVEKVTTDFSWLMRKCELNLLDSIAADYSFLEAASSVTRDRLKVWREFFRQKSHLLRRGNREWPMHRILLQLAAEHADDSPVTRAAAQWLEKGRCDWFWLRKLLRPQRVGKILNSTVFEGHTKEVNGVLELIDGRLLSWSADKTLRLWDVKSGVPLAVLEAHTSNVKDALELADGRLLSWSSSYIGKTPCDSSLRLWKSEDGGLLATLSGHTGWVEGALVLSTGRILSWSADKTLRLWNSQDGRPLGILKGHTRKVRGAIELADGRILSWSADGTLRLWDGKSESPILILKGHRRKSVNTSWDVAGVRGALELSDGKLLSWADETLRLWDPQTGSLLGELQGHTKEVYGALQLNDGSLLSWSEDETLLLWKDRCGKPWATLRGHTSGVDGAMKLRNGQILSWERGGEMRLWNSSDGTLLTTFKGHGGLHCVLELHDGRLVTCAVFDVLRCWSAGRGRCLKTLEGFNKVYELKDGRILLCDENNSMRLLESQGLARLKPSQDIVRLIRGSSVTRSGDFLIWTYGGTLSKWCPHDGQLKSTGKAKSGLVDGVMELQDGRLLSWCGDGTLQLWNETNLAPLSHWIGHYDESNRPLELRDGRLLTWEGDLWSGRQDGDTSPDDEKRYALHLWSNKVGAPLGTLIGHTGEIGGAIELRDGSLLSWSADKTLRLWDSRHGSLLAILQGHSDRVTEALELKNGQLLSWCAATVKCIWDGRNPEGRLEYEGRDSTLRLWRNDGSSLSSLKGHTGTVQGATELRDARILSWSADKTLRLWNQEGSPLAILRGHSSPVTMAIELSDGNLLSWSDDRMFRLWNGRDGVCIAMCSGKDVTSLHPDWLRNFRVATRSPCVARDILLESVGRSGALYHGRTPLLISHWNAEYAVSAECLLADGTAVLIQDNGLLCFLKLHYGTRRVSLAYVDEVILSKTKSTKSIEELR